MVNTQRGCTFMKKVIGSLLMSGALLGTVVAPLVANADANTTGNTAVSATFTKSTQTITPVDPTDPNTPSTGGDSGNGAAAGGDLSLIYAPKSLDFGTHEIDVQNNQSYAVDTSSAKSTLWDNSAVLEVADVRGTNAGWSLSASATSLTNGTTAAKGATITLPNGDVTNSGADKNGAVAVKTPVINLNGSSTGVQVLSAATGNGAGVTVDNLDPTITMLNIPANSVKANAYSSTITWTLATTPAN